MWESNMTITVLVVDDEPANIDLIKGILPDNVKVKAALKGAIALKLVSKQIPDLILLDLVMPELDGFQTLQKLRESEAGKNVPVAIISGNAEQSDIELGQEMGAIAHLQKPIQPQELLNIINQL